MSQGTDQIRLTQADQQAVDAMMDCGQDADRAPLALRGRAEKIAALLRLLNSLPEERSGDLLVQRTLGRIDQARRSRRPAEPVARSFGLGLGLSPREVLAMAAMLMVGISILWPMLAQARGVARQITCQQSLSGAGAAMGAYAAAYRGQMPTTGMKLGDPWWLTGQFDEQGHARSNSAHLFQLARSGYAPLSRLSCPENPHAMTAVDSDEIQRMRDWPTGQSVSYSYQNQYTHDRPHLDRGPVVAMLADKNPFFEPGRYRFQLGREHRDDAVSPNHGARGGQNVLTSTGNVRWLTTPRLDGDNIYHAGDRGLDNYTGLEGPRDQEDSFLVY